jgi:hypothetical protein
MGVCGGHSPIETATFKIPYLFNYITKLSRTQTEVTLNLRNAIVRGIGQGEIMHGKYKRRKLGGGQAYGHSAD